MLFVIVIILNYLPDSSSVKVLLESDSDTYFFLFRLSSLAFWHTF